MKSIKDSNKIKITQYLPSRHDDDDEENEQEAERRALQQAMTEGAFSRFKRKIIETDDGKRKRNELGDCVENDMDVVEDDDYNKLINNKRTNQNMIQSKAVEIVASELIKTRNLPWPETMSIVSSNPLPFGSPGSDGSPNDIHDDLKRELAFYNTALDAVLQARIQCGEYSIPFTRPSDFFAEMIKSDEHMAKIKDRLIFESKKIEAVEQRKLSKEQKSRVKEAQAYRLAEKAQAKRDHMKQVENWAKTAASNRPGGGKVFDDDGDQQYFDQMSGGGGGLNRKRMAKDKKYGYGGKKGRFKQMGRKSINDLSSFNPRGNFGGSGTKKTKTKAKRVGKRARDAAKAQK